MGIKERVKEFYERKVLTETLDATHSDFMQAELTLPILQRQKFQQRTNFAPRKGFEMIVKMPEGK